MGSIFTLNLDNSIHPYATRIVSGTNILPLITCVLSTPELNTKRGRVLSIHNKIKIEDEVRFLTSK